MPPSDRDFEPERAEPGVGERVSAALGAAADLLSTRAEIFGEEASQKAAHLGRGLGSFALALVSGWIAMLLLAALFVSLFTLLFGGRVWAGVLATLLLYGGAAAAGALLGWKAFSKVRPFDFPVTRQELREDWESLLSQWRAGGGDGRVVPPPPPQSEGVSSVARSDTEEAVDDFESRFRAGSE